MSSTKAVSSKQEKMIAKYLGWDVVSGSGARNFHPGDIISDNWLGECKTHMKKLCDITFYFDHWCKISREAASYNRYPALFCDDGTQDIKNTWVLFNLDLIKPIDCYETSIEAVKVSKNIIVNPGCSLYKYKKKQRSNYGSNVVIATGFPDLNVKLGLVPLSAFEEMFILH